MTATATSTSTAPSRLTPIVDVADRRCETAKVHVEVDRPFGESGAPCRR
jgi:hypothetical protein